MSCAFDLTLLCVFSARATELSDEHGLPEPAEGADGGTEVGEGDGNSSGLDSKQLADLHGSLSEVFKWHLSSDFAANAEPLQSVNSPSSPVAKRKIDHEETEEDRGIYAAAAMGETARNRRFSSSRLGRRLTCG